MTPKGGNYTDTKSPLGGMTLLGRLLYVLLHLAVADVDDAMRVGGDVGLVRDEDDRVAPRVQPMEHLHDFLAGLRVEVAGRLVGEQDGRVVHQGARDGDALALTAGQLVGAVAGARREL